MGYVPKFYNCTLEEMKTEGSKHLFYFKEKEVNENKIQIEVDQPIEMILRRMREVISGERNKLYLTRGMRDIDISYIGNNKWQLFDEFDVYEFELAL